jgi:hypothetical protein
MSLKNDPRPEAVQTRPPSTDATLDDLGRAPFGSHRSRSICRWAYLGLAAFPRLSRQRHSVAHDDGDIRFRQNVPGYAAEETLTQAAVRIGSHDDQ